LESALMLLAPYSAPSHRHNGDLHDRFLVHVFYVSIRIGNITGLTDGIHLPGDLYKAAGLLYKIVGDRRSIIERNHQCAFPAAMSFK
jgi:hypothetical protein